MMTGNLVWLLFRAHREGLSGAIEIRQDSAEQPATRVFVRARRAVHVEGIAGLLTDLATKLPSPGALTGELANDIPVCMALGVGLDEVFEAACAGLGRSLASMAQDPGLASSFNPDAKPPDGAFPLPKEFIRCFHQGLRAVRDADVVALELQTALDNPIRMTGEPEDIEEFGAVMLRTLKLARTENTLRGLVAAGGRGEPERTRESWFAIDLLMQLGLLQVEGSPVARASSAKGDRARGRAEARSSERLSESVVSAVPDRPTPPPRPPMRLESDEEADDVFAMGEDTGDLSMLHESVDDEDSDDEEVFEIEAEGPSHTIAWPSTARPVAEAPPVPTAGDDAIQGGLHESDVDAADVFAMGGDEDLDEIGEDLIEYLEDDEEWDDEDEDEDEDDLDDDDEAFAAVEDDDDDESLSASIDVAEDGDFEHDDFEDDLDDDDLAETTLDQESEPPRLRALPDEPEDTSAHDPTEGLDHPDAAELVGQFQALREANPLAVLGLGLDDVEGYITMPMLRRKAHLAAGRWHPERFADEHEHVRAAAEALFHLVERRWNALKDPRILTKALKEWKAIIPPHSVDQEGVSRGRHLYGRARQQATANAWTAALLTVGEALEADPTDLRCRLLDLQCRVVLEEFDVDSALANLDALHCRDNRDQAELEHTGGLLLKQAGRLDEAIDRFEWALEHDPKHVSAQRELKDAKSGTGSKQLSGIFDRD